MRNKDEAAFLRFQSSLIRSVVKLEINEINSFRPTTQEVSF